MSWDGICSIERPALLPWGLAESHLLPDSLAQYTERHKSISMSLVAPSDLLHSTPTFGHFLESSRGLGLQRFCIGAELGHNHEGWGGEQYKALYRECWGFELAGRVCVLRPKTLGLILAPPKTYWPMIWPCLLSCSTAQTQ